jgi:hypothetical protein
LFRTHFDTKILGNLSSYFDCEAIKDLLVAMRDMCIPPSWNDEDLTPTGLIPLEDGERVTHDQMIEAVETAILKLLKDSSPLGTQRLAIQSESVAWGATHASIDEDGIFYAPANMTKDLPPVVLDGMGKESPQTNIGIFHRVRAISYQSPTGFFSDRQSAAAQQMASGTGILDGPSYSEWNRKLQVELKKRRYVPEEAAEDLLGAFPTENFKRLKSEEF